MPTSVRHHRLGLSWTCFATSLMVAAIAGAGPNRAGKAKTVARASFDQNLRRWQSLSPERQNALRERHKQYRQLPSGQQERFRRLHGKFQRLDPATRRLCRANWALLARLDDKQLVRLKQIHAHVQQMPPEQRRRLVRVYKAFKERTVAQQTELIQHLTGTTRPANPRETIRKWLQETRTAAPTSRPSIRRPSAPRDRDAGAPGRGPQRRSPTRAPSSSCSLESGYDPELPIRPWAT